MAEMNFGCPHCGQAISCDSAWAGQQIQCPICQGAIIAPAPAAPSKPEHSPLVPKPPAGGGRLALNTNAQKPAQTGRDVPVRNLAPPPPPKKNILKTVAISVVVVAALGVGGYFGFTWLSERQAKMNAASREREKNSDGGQVGHIADLYDVLDKTEPGKIGASSRGGAKGPRQRQTGVGEQIPLPADGSAAANAPAASAAPVVPPVWTLNLAQAKIPESKANGKISGTNFVMETARIDPVGTAQTLRLVQGQLVSPDCEVLVYLHLKTGEKLGGQSLKIASDMRGTGVPTVTKRWKTNPRFAPQMKSFSTGYAMNLELGHLTNGTVEGKIYLALPDAEQTVVAGSFNAVTPQATDPALQPAVIAPAAVPAASPMSPAEQEAYRRRYGPR